MSRYLVFFYLLFVVQLMITPGKIAGQGFGNVRTVVIDAGHGGHDPGALGKKSKEKNINLIIALRLGNLIQKNMKGVKVIYTRDRDNFVELYRRAEIANRNKADLFISIHCNAAENRNLSGAETYIMGLHKSKANLNIAKLENAAILLESDYQSSYEGFDPNSDESYILFNLYQNSNLERSTAFAAAIQEQLTERVGMKDRGVRQAGFLVLYKTTMPSVLVETGYISNAADEKYLNSETGQEYIAMAIYRAFRSYSSYEPEKTTGPVVARQPQDTGTTEKVVVSDRNPDDKNVITPLEFRIQVATSAKQLPKDAKIFSQFKNVKMYQHGGLYKYTVGGFPDLVKAQQMLDEVKRRGFPDAFVVIFRNNERIPQTEADQILKK
jgi:N-acetylmuramoyl-L-alanine amidase